LRSKQEEGASVAYSAKQLRCHVSSLRSHSDWTALCRAVRQRCHFKTTYTHKLAYKLCMCNL